MVLKVPLYLSIEGLEYDDLTLEEFRELQDNLTRYYTSGVNLANRQQLNDTKYHLELVTEWFSEHPLNSIQRYLEESTRSSKRKILSIPRLIDREEALEHLRKGLA